jgi:hypothetical protein
VRTADPGMGEDAVRTGQADQLKSLPDAADAYLGSVKPGRAEVLQVMGDRPDKRGLANPRCTGDEDIFHIRSKCGRPGSLKAIIPGGIPCAVGRVQ